MKKQTRTSKTTITAALKRMEAGERVPAIAKRFGVNTSTVYYWKKARAGSVPKRVDRPAVIAKTIAKPGLIQVEQAISVLRAHGLL